MAYAVDSLLYLVGNSSKTSLEIKFKNDIN